MIGKLYRNFLLFSAVSFCLTIFPISYGMNCEDAQLLQGELLQVNNGTVMIKVYHPPCKGIRTFRLGDSYNPENLVPGKKIRFLLCGSCETGFIVIPNNLIEE